MPRDEVAGVADVLVVDLLGGIGDLVMLLPSLRGLARRHPRAAVRVLTHAPGATLLDPDPDVAEVRAVRKGTERAAVVAELERRPPDLVVSTTRYDGIAEEIERRVPGSVTDLWRRPPPDEPVARRYHRILTASGTTCWRACSPRVTPGARARATGRSPAARGRSPAPSRARSPAAGPRRSCWSPTRAWP